MIADEKRKLLTHKADVLKAIAHPARLCIISCLMRSEECNVSALQKELNLPQSTISQHMAKLKSQGVIEGERHGVEVVYHIVDESIYELLKHYLQDVFNLKESEEPMC
ncbi:MULTISPECIES: metalloregulator ArsR/SmtB family transcription factor [unclassified Fusibacter]|uniref:ArsR/SmtB family transcription factor n=1 Tax=unclassified Fusibacter TaxID=2624464 RepID=UPI0010112437|nr:MULTISPECIES: metalloregulator ArsR/SmtB family transcription factor [unclassified Fusibacter]MCK8060065.1 metalloregulator ArsR/SmtB family transcription factor [Fusibacter sp. A2]NPE22207.1 winged helix-turn-helix transcriptional regulator [Fusibacter sp. A1]RXV60981.1 ArsR family transcriptional regulator [Fusibacter sp. A1]